MRTFASLSLFACGLLVARFAVAHHSFAAVFDGEKFVKVTGEVVGVEWTNPHFHISLDVKDEAGAVTALAIRRLSAEHARAARLAPQRDADAWRDRDRRGLGRARRLGSWARCAG